MLLAEQHKEEKVMCRKTTKWGDGEVIVFIQLHAADLMIKTCMLNYPRA